MISGHLIDVCRLLYGYGTREDEEEVGPPPIPGYFNSHVPVWYKSSRTGSGKRFQQDSEQCFTAISSSQVKIKLSYIKCSVRTEEVGIPHVPIFFHI